MEDIFAECETPQDIKELCLNYAYNDMKQRQRIKTQQVHIESLERIILAQSTNVVEYKIGELPKWK